MKIYTNKVLKLIEKPIYNFLKEYYITAIENISFYLAQIIGKMNVKQR